MSFLDDRIFALVDSVLDSRVTNTLQKVEYTARKSKLRKDVQKNFLEKYGDEVFFDMFDNFLEKNETINKFIKQCYSTERQQYNESNTWIKSICEDFIGIYPKFNIYNSTINIALNELYNIIFENLNNSKESDQTRIVTNQMKEIAVTSTNEVIIKIEELKKELENSETKNVESSSSYVIESAKELSKVFVQTSLFEKAIVELENKNIIALVGDSGIGKSTTSFMLANNFAPMYEVTFIEGTDTQGENDINRVIKEIKKNVQKNEIIVFDDFLGKTKLNDSKTYIMAIEELLKTIKNCSSKKLILNSRKTILESAKNFKKSLEDFLKYHVFTLDITNGYNNEDRMKIFASYILKNKINDRLDDLLKNYKTLNSIINHDNFNPLIIERATIVCQDKTSEQIGETILVLLDNPQFLWEKEVDALDDNALNYLFVLYSLSDTFIDRSIVDNCYKVFIKKNGIKQTESFEDIVKCLAALVSYDKKGKITFRHPSLIDYLSKKIYYKKDELLSGAIYFEQIERLDEDKDKINELLSSPQIFFKLKVLPIVSMIYPNQDIEVADSICVRYLKCIYEFDIKNKEYEDAIIVALECIFKRGHMLVLFSSDIIINILSMQYYDLSAILANEKNMELLYGCSTCTNIWNLMEITVKKDESGFNFSKMKPYVQNEISYKLSEIASNETERFIESKFDEYMFNNIDYYDEDDDYDYIAQDIIEMIINDLDLIEVGTNGMITCTKKYSIYNLDVDTISYELYDYDNLIEDFAIGKISNYITKINYNVK
ncbi:hypothetical protein [Clostridium botulinum]|uniref:nSTAND3 domain-containing NTPase n=1 Tax=Clostridium botulinum TaxID=1491 RepID=UPI0007730EF6|nr:hypothetical protein [Clostridium botulinum]MBY6930652.1 hypothetical protein [Clostridium botulinum]NFG21842.1 hypothetical protein [Clostridium botulinum]NFO79761.1 hypothetical protein [Clostridium botulinum]